MATNNKPSARGSFGSRIGIVLATAGSAVGLGNVWRFPYMTGQDGGAAFILIYLACVLLLGIPGMVSEFIVGRRAATNAARAYRTMAAEGGSSSKQKKRLNIFGCIGYMGVLTSMIILGFYAVVAGWCLQYLYAAIGGALEGNKDYIIHYFTTFSSHPLKPALWAVAFVVATHIIVARGVQSGIERAAKLMMPLLLVLLVVMVVAACLLPGAIAGIEFLFKPDFTKITHNVFLDALGQAFFSLSLGTACLCTYASYFRRNTDLITSATQIAVIDIAIAILAGLMIFPAAFSVGVNPDSGPSLIFITLPNVFQQAFAMVPGLGYCISVLFYALMTLAALTSTISMHEIGTAFFHEELHISRRSAATIVTVVCSAVAVISSLSVGADGQLAILGKPLMDCFDYVTAQLLMPVGAFLTCLLVGWSVPRQVVVDELAGNATSDKNSTETQLSTHTRPSTRTRAIIITAYLFAVRYLCPIAIAAIFLHQFGLF